MAKTKSKGFTTFSLLQTGLHSCSLHKRGFTLVELLVVIVIIAVLAVVGAVIFTSVKDAVNDARMKADINALAKAYEVKYDGVYHPVEGADFADGVIPTAPDGSSYTPSFNENLDGFQICATLSGGSSYCGTSVQGQYVEPSPTPTPTPATTPTPTPASTPTPTPTPPAPQTVIFQRGSANSYSTTIDCILVAIEVNTCGTQNLNLNNNGSSPQDTAVIKFPDMFGSNAGQIPPNSVIVSAELELTVSEVGPDVSVHQILEDWSASAVANYSPTRTRRIGGGSSVNWTNSGAGLPTSSNSTPDDTKSTSVLGAVSFNIGNIVSNWSANTNNNRGVVLRHSSFTDTSNTFRSSEYSTVANRPKLTVTFTPP